MVCRGLRPVAYASLALLILLSSLGAQAQPLEDACPDTKITSLFLAGGGALSTVVPSEQGSLPIQASAGVALSWLVGSWSTPAVVMPLTYSGSLNFSIWAQASGPVQLSCRFQVYVGVNDVRPASPINSNTAGLGSTPTEYSGAGDVSLSLKAGDTIGLWIYSAERGLGGELLFGGNCPSRIEMALPPLSVNLTVHSTPGSLKLSGNATSIWGASDISDIKVAVMGPFSKSSTDTCGRELYAAKTRVVKEASGAAVRTGEESQWEVSFSYTWKYDAATVKEGQYVATALVFTVSNSTSDADAWVGIVPSKGGFLMGSSPALLGVILVVIAVAMGGTAAYLYRSGKGAALLENKKALVAVGVSALLCVAAIGMFVSLTPAPSSGSEKAPGFVLNDVDGKRIALSDFRGSVVVLDMMATWCPTCNQEIPELKAFRAKNPDVVVISIDVDKSETSALLKKHMESKGANWIYCVDSGSVMKDYHVTNIPLIVIINPSGQITFMKADLVKADELGNVVQAARSGSAPILALGSEMGLTLMAFLAGLSAFFSPCAFPLLPGYMTFYMGRKEAAAASQKETVRKAFFGGTAAAAGILAIYALVGVLIALAGEAIKGYVGILAPIVAVAIIIMGAVMLTDYVIPLYRITAPFAKLLDGVRGKMKKMPGREMTAEKGYYSGLMSYGAGYGAASLGCHAPIFIAVVVGGLAAGGFGSALLAFVMYGVGMGLLMVIVTVLVGMAKTRLVQKLQHLMPTIKKISGIVLVIVGIVLVYNYYLSIA